MHSSGTWTTAAEQDRDIRGDRDRFVASSAAIKQYLDRAEGSIRNLKQQAELLQKRSLEPGRNLRIYDEPALELIAALDASSAQIGHIRRQQRAKPMLGQWAPHDVSHLGRMLERYAAAWNPSFPNPEAAAGFTELAQSSPHDFPVTLPPLPSIAEPLQKLAEPFKEQKNAGTWINEACFIKPPASRFKLSADTAPSFVQALQDLHGIVSKQGLKAACVAAR